MIDTGENPRSPAPAGRPGQFGVQTLTVPGAMKPMDTDEPAVLPGLVTAT